MLQRLLSGSPNLPITPECGPLSEIAASYLRQTRTRPAVQTFFYGTSADLTGYFRRRMDGMLSAIFQKESDGNGALIIKDPGALSVLRGYFELIENLQVVVITRSPYEILASRKVAFAKLNRTWSTAVECSRIQDDWIRIERALHMANERSFKCHVTTYDAAVTAPEVWADSLESHLGIAFVRSLVDSHTNSPFSTEISGSSWVELNSGRHNSAEVLRTDSRMLLDSIWTEYEALRALPAVFTPLQALRAMRSRRTTRSTE